MSWSLALRNLCFIILQPGTVVGLVPWLILNGSQHGLPEAYRTHHYLAILVFLLGLLVLLHCVYGFATEGQGTLSPLDPTTALVTSGLYHYSRNPMYLGVMMMLLGEVVLTRSLFLGLYAALVFIGFNLFVAFYEEPRLRKAFPEAFDAYSQQVNRWL